MKPVVGAIHELPLPQVIEIEKTLIVLVFSNASLWSKTSKDRNNIFQIVSEVIFDTRSWYQLP
jgi:hypothetical protein